MKTNHTICCVLIALASPGTPASDDMLGDVNNDGLVTTDDSPLALFGWLTAGWTHLTHS